MLESLKAKQTGAEWTASTVFRAVFEDRARFEKAMNGLGTLMKLSPEDLAETLGFDPRNVAPADIQSEMARIFGESALARRRHQ